MAPKYMREVALRVGLHRPARPCERQGVVPECAVSKARVQHPRPQERITRADLERCPQGFERLLKAPHLEKLKPKRPPRASIAAIEFDRSAHLAQRSIGLLPGLEHVRQEVMCSSIARVENGCAMCQLLGPIEPLGRVIRPALHRHLVGSASKAQACADAVGIGVERLLEKRGSLERVVPCARAAQKRPAAHGTLDRIWVGRALVRPAVPLGLGKRKAQRARNPPRELMVQDSRLLEIAVEPLHLEAGSRSGVAEPSVQAHLIT